MTTAQLTKAVTYPGDGSQTLFSIPFDFRGRASRSATYLQVSLLDVDRSLVRLSAGVDFALTGPITALNVSMVTAPAIGTVLIIDRLEPALPPNQLRDNGPFPARQIEAELNNQARSLQDTARAADRSLRVSVADEDVAMTMPPLPGNGGEVVPVMSRAGMRFQSVANVDAVAARAQEIARLGTETLIEAMTALGTPSRIAVMEGLDTIRDDIAQVNIDRDRIGIVARADVRALMANATDPDNLALYIDLNGNRTTYQAVANIDQQIVQVAATQTRQAIETAANPANLDTYRAVQAITADVQTVASISGDISNVIDPAVQQRMADILEPDTQTAIRDTASIKNEVRTIAGMAGKINALGAPAALTGINTLTTQPALSDLRLAGQNITQLRNVGNNIIPLMRIDQQSEKLLEVIPQARSVRTALSDPRVEPLLRASPVVASHGAMNAPQVRFRTNRKMGEATPSVASQGKIR